MADKNLALQLLITAKDGASSAIKTIKDNLVALGVAVGAAFTIKGVMDFEVALDRLRARADETGPALDAIIASAKAAAMELGPRFGYSATQAVNGLTDLVAAGFSAKESIDALPGVLALAAMEGIEVSKAATMMSDAIAQFGLQAADASKVADILAKAAGAVAATATEMAEALKYTGTMASSAGMSLTDTAATLDVLAKAGVRGSEGGTALASVLGILANPAHTATKALFDMGLTSTKLSDVLDFLQARGINAAEAIALFGEQGGRALNVLLQQGGSAGIKKFADDIEKTGRSAEQTAKIMQENLSGALKRFWEELKVVGIELKDNNLGVMTKGIEALTAKLKEYASAENINAFQANVAAGLERIKANFLAMADGINWSGLQRQINDLWTTLKQFAGNVDWDGIYQAAGSAFDKIRESATSLWGSIQTLVTALTGSFPTAASVAEQASTALKTVWNGIRDGADYVAQSVEKLALALSDDTPAGVAQRALSAVRKKLADAEYGYDALTKAQQAGKATQEQVAESWSRLQQAMGQAAQQVQAAQSAYDALVAAQQAGNATQEQVQAAWNQLQAVIKSTGDRIDNAKLTHEALSDSFKMGAVVIDAVKAAHERMAAAQDKTAQSSEAVKVAVQNQQSGWDALWASLKSTATEETSKVLDGLNSVLQDTLKFIRDLADNGFSYASGALDALKPAFSTVTDFAAALGKAIMALLGVFKPSMEGMKSSGLLMGNAVGGVFNALATGASVVSAAILKLTETVLTGWLEIGKLSGVISEEDATVLQGRIDKIGTAAGEMFDVALKSANGFQANVKGMADAIEGTTPAIEKSATAVEHLQTAHEVAQAKIAGLTEELAAQKGALAAMAQADDSSAEAKQRQAAATQRVWELQDELTKAQAAAKPITAALAEEQLKAAKAAGETVAELQPYIETTLAVIDGQEKLGKTTKGTVDGIDENTRAWGNAIAQMDLAQPTLNALKNGISAAQANLEKANSEVANAEKGTFAYAIALTKQENAIAAVKSATAAYDESLRLAQSGQAQAVIGSGNLAKAQKEQVVSVEALLAKVAETKAAYEKEAELQKAGVKNQQALNAAKTAATNAISALNVVIERNIENAEKAEALATKEVTAQQRKNTETEKGIALDIARANSAGNYNAVAEITVELDAQQAANAADLAEKQKAEAKASQEVADAEKAKYEALLKTDPLNKTAIADALKSAETAQVEADAKRDSADASTTRAKELKNETESTAAFNKALSAGIATLHESTDAEKDLADSKVTAAEASLELAKAQGDENKIAEATTALNQTKIDQAQQIADTKHQELAIAQSVLAAKQAEAEADGILTEAEQEMLANAGKIVEAKGNQAKAAQENVAATKAQADATQKAAEAAKNAKEAEEARTSAGKAAAKTMNDGLAVLEATGGEMDKLTKRFYEQQGAITANAAGWDGWAAGTARAAQEVKQAYENQKAAITGMDTALQQFNETGIYNAQVQQAMIQAGGDLASQFDLMDQQSFDNLRSSLDQANEKLREMQQEAQDATDRLAELDAELAAERGDTATADRLKLELEGRQAIADLDAQIAKAQMYGNRQLLEALEEQRIKLIELYNLRERNLEREIQSRQEQERTSKAQSDAPAGNSATVTSGSSTGGLSNRSNAFSLTVNTTGGIIDANFAEELARKLKPKLDEISRRSL